MKRSNTLLELAEKGRHDIIDLLSNTINKKVLDKVLDWYDTIADCAFRHSSCDTAIRELIKQNYPNEYINIIYPHKYGPELHKQMKEYDNYSGYKEDEIYEGNITEDYPEA